MPPLRLETEAIGKAAPSTKRTREQDAVSPEKEGAEKPARKHSLSVAAPRIAGAEEDEMNAEMNVATESGGRGRDGKGEGGKVHRPCPRRLFRSESADIRRRVVQAFRPEDQSTLERILSK